jgi:hypothetical protein
VVAAEGVEGAELHPTSAQFGRGVTAEPADVRAHHRDAEQVEVQQLCITTLHSIHHHHQPINVSTAGAQAFLMNYPQGEQVIAHHAGPVRIVTTANTARTSSLTSLPKHGEARDNKFLVTDPMTDQRCLASTIAH